MTNTPARLALATLCLVTASANANAQSSAPQVSFELDACVEADRDEVQRITVLELRAALADPSLSQGAAVRVQVRCEGADLHIAVDDPLTRKSLARAVRVNTVESHARTRLVALAIAELVIASWAELEDPTPRITEPTSVAPTPDQLAAAQSLVHTRLTPPAALVASSQSPPLPPATGRFGAWITAGGALRVFTDRYGALVFGGGALAGTVRWTPAFETRVGIDALYAARPLAYGTLSATLFEARASAHLTYARDVFSLTGGVGVGFGPARYAMLVFDPISNAGSDSVVPWGGAFLNVNAAWKVHRSMRVALEVEGGYTMFESVVRATPTGIAPPFPVFALEGPWLGVKLGAQLGSF